MKTKKMCAGFDGNEHEAYIYKNIDGKKYCKLCTFKLQPPKGIRAVSVKNSNTFRLKLKQTQIQKDKQFYLKIWEERFYTPLSNGEMIMWKAPRCERCYRRLGEEPLTLFFHHILEKRNYPELRYHVPNIAILCSDCHSSYESRPDLFPDLIKRRKELMEYWKNEFLYKTEKNQENVERDRQ